MDEAFGLDELGRLDVFCHGQSAAAEGEPESEPESPRDEEVPAGWEPDDDSDLAECRDPDDDPDAWLASLPADLRAEVAARRPVTVVPWEAGPAVARATFASGGLGDAMLPGRGLAELLAEAMLDGHSGLSDDELAGLMRACQRQVAHYQALLARAVTELAERRQAESLRPGWSGLVEHVQDEVATELTLTGWSAGRLIDEAAGQLRLPEVWQALLNGTIDWARAGVFTGELAVLDDATARAITERLVEAAAGWTTGQLRVALRRAVLAADPAAAERRKRHGRKDARVEVWAEGSGNAALAGRELRPSTAILLDQKLTSDARWLAARGVPGTQDQLRALAYTTLLSGRRLDAVLDDPASWPGAGTASTADAAGTSDPGGEAAACAGLDDAAWAGDGAAGSGRASASGSIHLIVPVSAWLGGGEPGEVAGHGTVDAQTSRELAAVLAGDPVTRWCVTFTGAGGEAVAHSCARRGPVPGEPVIGWVAGLRHTARLLAAGGCGHARASPAYRPPGTLAHLVRVRQRRCAFPGCRRAATRCDLDHTVPFNRGGLSCECNLAPLCRRHHRAKQTPGWHLAQGQPGQMTWRLPSGRTRHTAGDPYRA